MIGFLSAVGRQALFAFDPETAHGLTITALKSGVPLCPPVKPDPILRQTIAGLDFPNPLGMAAGFDKNAEVPDALLRLGFGFAEVGTVTPLPQAGNPRPRIFRLVSDRAVINRLGFNNEGHATALARLVRRRRSGIVGVNIGANKDSADRIADYVLGVECFASVADYLTVNISSPNTPGLRALQSRDSLAELLGRVVEARGGNATAIFLKIAPDLVQEDFEDIAAVLKASGLEGLIVSNTTLSRTGLTEARAAKEAGGLSGAPLFERSTIALARMRRLLGPDFAIVGVGGVHSAETALEKISAGADLVQLYTGMIYEGPTLPGRIVSGMARELHRADHGSLRDLRDTRLDAWADRDLP